MTDSASTVGSLSEKSSEERPDRASHEEHLRLAGIVKGVHADLRKKYKRSTGETELERIWYEHCQNKPVLSQYADAMHHLATDHWTKHQETRIDWCREVINEYFKHDGLKKVLEKERRRKEKQKDRNKFQEHSAAQTEPGRITADFAGTDGLTTEIYPDHVVTNNNVKPETGFDFSVTEAGTGSKHNFVDRDQISTAESRNEDISRKEYNLIGIPVEDRIRLLDVGSCFNPFLEFPELQSVGIDISPAAESVFHCDFLHLRTTDPLQVANDTMTTFINNLNNPIDWLPRELFHVVVFSLLLEYFPAPYQRWISCQKAHELLMYNGILVIVTPDSSHQNRNASMMKSWKIAIESIGFKRWRYVKQEHIHCMVFRKIEITDTDKQENFLKGITPDMIYIPQDFHDVAEDFSSGVDATSPYSYEDEQFYREHILHELPVLTSESDENDD
ncbi:S-adenosylmethionine sensor upstream of mTORC1-like [Mercenaria mercenaria]|uniref:S-adenosylmethionine sensor upstream of mTORC1-like n=1 Tax=Mercenaria mercenaria TaxID=6596 RepID=UPI00234F6DAF|nr:S-adenosylmethionine sensor upstream of mTORC1-like [Mercenaria mercenaria]XP_053377211.1 S-adenosylmethionine sensor upstream of mTORC1-like [Mercenaria mercenaria]XP_053377212.1 S-adenosylmethionine sensor upstream of mTORC1-like [Mercenaria mercenaria]